MSKGRHIFLLQRVRLSFWHPCPLTVACSSSSKGSMSSSGLLGHLFSHAHTRPLTHIIKRKSKKLTWKMINAVNSRDSEGQTERLPAIRREGGCEGVMLLREGSAPELRSGLCFLAYRCCYDCRVAFLSNPICFDTEEGRKNSPRCPRRKARLFIAAQTLQNAHRATKAMPGVTEKPGKPCTGRDKTPFHMHPLSPSREPVSGTSSI